MPGRSDPSRRPPAGRRAAANRPAADRSQHWSAGAGADLPTPRRRSARRRRNRGPKLLVVGLVVLAGGIAGTVLGGDGGTDGSAAVQTPTPALTIPASAPHTGAKAAGRTVAGANASSSTASDAALPGGADDPRQPARWPLHDASARAERVPILMYHLVAPAPAGTAYPGLWVPPAELRAHVKALAAAGFTGVTLGEVWDAWHGDSRLPRHPVVLSFDDGDLTQVLGAAPVLVAAGWPGVLNLATNHLGKGGIPMWGARRLVEQGWEIDSHTITHSDVTGLGAEALREELEGSRKAIKARLGVTPRFFCYPAGRNDPTSRAAVQAAGYLAATTTEPGLAGRSGDPFALPRVRVDPGMAGGAIVALAEGRATQSAAAGE